MNSPRPLYWILLLVGAASHFAAEPVAPSAKDYAAFRLVTDRNIFNTARTSRSGRSQGEERKAPRVDTITLVGTLSSDKGVFAFFDGSGSQFRKVLEPGKTIADYKVTDITPNAVQLDTGTNTIALQVGMQIRREEDGPWAVAGGHVPSANATVTASSEPASGDEDDIVKKLIQQREQELK